MGTCGCSSENSFFKVGDKTILMEKWEDCEDCGGQQIMIHILDDKDRSCFDELESKSVKEKELATWMYSEKDKKRGIEPIIIYVSDFKDKINRKLENTFEGVWDDYEALATNEFRKFPEKFKERFEKKIIKRFLELLKVEE